MKTPEEIKHALECCSNHIMDSDCSCCEYGQEANCDAGLHFDALDYIRRLEAEREALLKIVHDYAGCKECVHVSIKPELPPCSDCGVLGKNWVWRGAGKEQNENA